MNSETETLGARSLRRMDYRRHHIQLIAYRLAAWIIGGTVHQFEGRDLGGRWHRGLCILSLGALVAHKVCFRKNASVYSDTALVEPNEKGKTHENI